MYVHLPLHFLARDTVEIPVGEDETAEYMVVFHWHAPDPEINVPATVEIITVRDAAGRRIPPDPALDRQLLDALDEYVPDI